jgi:hypothetical protein
MMKQKYQLTWNAAKPFLLPYEGGCSQIVILGLLKSDIQTILRVISNKVQNLAIAILAGEPLEPNIPLPDAYGNKALMSQVATRQLNISAMMFDNADITFDFQFEKHADTFDLEVWFWADQFFPGNDESYQYRFTELCTILAAILKENNNQVILTPSEASDPLLDLAKGIAIELQL